MDGDGGHGHTRLRETKTDLEAPLETVGQDLRAARQNRGEDLASVSRALKIRKEHLEALEEDKMELLPGRTYAVGFIRSYATYLGLDPVVFVGRFKDEIAGRNEMTAPPVDVIDEDEHKKLPQGWWAIAGVVLLLVLYGAYQLMAAADRAMREQVSEPPSIEAANPPPPKPIKVQPPAPAPVEQPADAAPTDGQATPPNAQPAGAQPGQPGQPQPGQPQSGQPQSGQPLAGQPRPNVQTPAPLPPGGQVYGLMNKNPRVVLRAWQPTRVLVEGTDRKIYILKILKPGDVYQVPNIPGLKLTVASANAVEIVLDGQSVGRVGRGPDAVEAMSIDPQAIAGHYRH